MEVAELQKVFLYPAAILVATRPVRIATLLGTCVAVCLWDSKTKIGGMNHYLLPLWNGEGLASPKYGNIAIEKLLNELVFHGADKKNIVAKIFGGRMQSDGGAVPFHIGLRNSQIAKQMLADLSIPIVAENVGGELGMTIQFDTSTGIVKLKYIRGGIKAI